MTCGLPTRPEGHCQLMAGHGGACNPKWTWERGWNLARGSRPIEQAMEHARVRERARRNKAAN